MKDSNKPDSKKLSDLIKESDITLQDLAEVLNYNRATIRERKNNPDQYTIAEIMKLSKVLKRTPTAIVKIILRELNDISDEKDQLNEKDSK
ncbi:helix-turn-helix domain-containing protein [Spirosoma flavum]|uniref:Helix-turn-helix domain-containing protein n=1 Tax=Spirosoma flavum TaxID=2048557 RepID=A0ABW6ATV4_9BACT